METGRVAVVAGQWALGSGRLGAGLICLNTNERFLDLR